MRPIPIRLRLTGWYAAVLLAALLLFAFGLSIALERRLMAGVDERLASRMQGLRNALGAENEIAGRAQLASEVAEFAATVPDGAAIELRNAAGEYLGDTRVPRDGPRRLYTARLRSAGETWDVTMAADLADVHSVLGDFRRFLLLLALAALALACAGGYWLSSRALRPVDDITAVARSIGVQSLSQRVAAPHTRDEIERMAQAWNELLDRLESSVERIRRFTADASHELRTPLALIRANAELALRRDRPPDEYRRTLREIEAQTELMTTLTESLLTIARADADGGALPLESTDLGQLVACEVEQQQAIASEKRVTLCARLGGPVPALANAAGLQRLLRILIDNALRHTPEGGTVVVAAAPDARGPLLSVEDTGEGIDPADLPHIFERFYRSDRVRGGGGFGLGLAIAHAIAGAHGSRIVVESAPGKGARFSMRLSA